MLVAIRQEALNIAKSWIVNDVVGMRSELSDFEFLLDLGRKRDWKSTGCCICLADPKHIGQVCECGISSIAVLRPCGHAICANPCHSKISADENKSLAPLVCPLCRASVSKAIVVESIKLTTEKELGVVSRGAERVEARLYDACHIDYATTWNEYFPGWQKPERRTFLTNT